MRRKSAGAQNLEMMSDETKEVFMSAVVFYKNEYLEKRAEHGSISTAAAFHDEIDRLIDKLGVSKEASCKKGCSFCCSIHNEITSDEAELLIEYSKEIGLIINRDQLAKQQGKSEEDYFQMKSTDRRCVFLSPEGDCRVYQHRPGTCRKYYVVSDPKLCDLDASGPDEVSVIMNNHIEAVFSATGLAAEKVELMADLLIEKLNEQARTQDQGITSL